MGWGGFAKLALSLGVPWGGSSGFGSAPAPLPQGSKRKRGAKPGAGGSTRPGTQLSLRAFLRAPNPP